MRDREAHVFAADATTRATRRAADGDRAGQRCRGRPLLVALARQRRGRSPLLTCFLERHRYADNRGPTESVLNILELALVPTTFLNLGLIEVVEDFVERQERTTLD